MLIIGEKLQPTMTFGHLYAGSIAFGTGYDVTTGAYDMFFNGGIGSGGNGTDICIS